MIGQTLTRMKKYWGGYRPSSPHGSYTYGLYYHPYICTHVRHVYICTHVRHTYICTHVPHVYICTYVCHTYLRICTHVRHTYICTVRTYTHSQATVKVPGLESNASCKFALILLQCGVWGEDTFRSLF